MEQKLKIIVKEILDRIQWCLSYRKISFILENTLGIRLIIYPWERGYLRVLKGTHDFDKEFAAIERLISPGGVVFDIGANVGIYSIFCSRLVGEKGKVFAFEPVPYTFQCLHENIVLNNCTNVIISKEAVSDTDGNVTMNIYPEKLHPLNSLSTKAVLGDTIEVATSVVCVNTICQQNNLTSIDLLKIDVEGFEDQVINGSSDLLKEGKVRYIQFEISMTPLLAAEKTVEELFAAINSYKYQIYRYNKSNNSFEGPISGPDNDFDNYYASREDLVALNKKVAPEKVG